MPSTRAAARGSPSAEKGETAAGSKRKVNANSPKGSRKAAKKQTTIEDSLAGIEANDAPKSPPDDAEMQGIESAKDGKANGKGNGEDHANLDPKTEQEEKPEEADATNDGTKVEEPDAQGEDTVQESSQREKKIASNIMEKGVIYFFTRNRVGIEDADSVGDLARSYFVLRPLPIGTKLGEGALPDLENNRLFALPKKVFPKSHNDRFMAFVEKSNATIQDLKDNFLKGDEYETKTQGTRHVEPMVPVAEGVYFLTRTEDRSTHLVYAITIPSKLGELQEDLGLRSQGSWVVSTKNPERPGPANATLPQGPDFPKEFIEEFRGLAWSEVKPKYLDHANTQILLIGEHTEKATQATTKDQKHGKDTPQEELEQLEHEDELRVEHLNGDDSVFDDLRLDHKEYSQVPTTW